MKGLSAGEIVLIAILGAAAIFHAMDAHADEQEQVQHAAASAAVAAIAYDWVRDTEHPVIYATGIAVSIRTVWNNRNNPYESSGADAVMDVLGALIGGWTAHGLYYRIKKDSITVSYTKEF